MGTRSLTEGRSEEADGADLRVASEMAADRPFIEVFGAESSDAQLVAAIVARNEEAYAEVFRRHYCSVAAASRMILGSSSDCDDVVAEVFVALWLSPAGFDPSRGSLLGFLRMRAKARSIDVLRSLTARRRREDRDATGKRGAELVLTDTSLLDAEAAAQVHVAVCSLPLAEQEVIRLAYFGGLKYVAVAEKLGIPEGTAKSRIRSGLRRLATNADIQAQSRSPDLDCERLTSSTAQLKQT